MNSILTVNNLTKRFDSFTLDGVSFDLPGGSIMGLVGENGAGKTTTLKLILGLLHRDGGDVTIFGLDPVHDQRQIKEQLGVVFDECSFPDNLTAPDVGGILSRLYRNWDAARFRSCCERFSLPAKKTVKEYSRGMKMKLQISAALSHSARLLILDEATGGLDPVARDEILDLFLEFIGDEDHSILFSSHITGDLEKIADYVTFLHEGRVIFSKEKDALLERYGVLKCGKDDLARADRSDLIRVRAGRFGCEALVQDRAAAARKYRELVVDPASIEEIMLFYARGSDAQEAVVHSKIQKEGGHRG